MGPSRSAADLPAQPRLAGSEQPEKRWSSPIKVERRHVRPAVTAKSLFA